jgi:hypothetical protein
MKSSRVGALAVALAALILFPGSARAVSGSDVLHEYFADANMTGDPIGYTWVECNRQIIRWGIYPGGPGWQAYYQSHGFVYDRYTQSSCETGELVLQQCYTLVNWYGSKVGYYCPYGAVF